MSESTLQSRSAGFKTGWWILIVFSGLTFVMDISLLFVFDLEPVSVAAQAGLGLFGLFVLLFPFRRLEKWSWFIIWVLTIPPLLIGLDDPAARPYFFTAVGLVVVSLLLTGRDFFSRR